MSVNELLVLIVPLLVAVLLLLVLVADLVAPPDSVDPGSHRGIGGLTAVGLLGILAATHWVPLGGIIGGGAWVQDSFALYVQRIVLLAGALCALGSIDHVSERLQGRQGEYYLLMLSSLLGMVALAGSRDLLSLIVSFELMGIPLYAMAALAKTERPGVEGALKLYLVGAVSAAVTLYGLSFVYGATGTTRIAAIAVQVAEGPTDPLLILGMLLTLAGMGFKIGAVPFHLWVPDTYQGAPTPFVAFLSVAPKVAGFTALARLYLDGFGALRAEWWPLVMVIGIATLLLGNLMAVPQQNSKRLLAYSGIGHIGLLLLVFGIGTTQGVAALLFYMLAYVPTNMGAFFVVGAVGAKGDDSVGALRGLSRRSPALGLAMLVFLLSLGGIPPVAGFWAKLVLFMALWNAGMGALVLLGAAASTLALFYYLRVAHSIYIAPPGDLPAPTLGRPTAWAIGLCLLLVVAMGLWPRPFIDAALAAAHVMLAG